MEKINNLDMASIGRYYPCRVPFEAKIDTTIGLDYLEQRLYGKSLWVVGFWEPTLDRNYMRVVVDTSEFPYEVTPFMRMQIFLSKMNGTAQEKWAERLDEERREGEELEIERQKQKEWDAAHPEEVEKRQRITFLLGERSLLLNRRDGYLQDKPFGVDTRKELLQAINDRLKENAKKLLTLGVKEID